MAPLDSSPADLVVPADVLADVSVSPDEARLELAVALFARQRASLGQAARLAGVSQEALLDAAAQRDAVFPYDLASLDADLATLRALGRL